MSVEYLHSVPHLTTALTGPLLHLESHLLERQTQIETWLRRQWLATPAPFYASVDLRNAGFKLAPVDTNLFPAGFNNLNPAFTPLAIQAIQAAVEHVCPTSVRLLILPESHTRNRYYLESLATLAEITQKAGFEVRIGSLRSDLTEPHTFPLDSGRQITLEPVYKDGRRLVLSGYDPCLILLNNDLSSGRPALLEDVEQPIAPPPYLGWSQRRKSVHFSKYREVTEEFSKLMDIDSWLIDPLFRNCGEIDFMTRDGEDCLVRHVTELLEDIQDKYNEYSLDKEPYVMVKADSGTYGMGIMTARSGADMRQLNRKQRTKMASSKSGQSVTRVIMQEGVYTFETWGENEAPAEPVVYLIDHFVIGGFYRVHTQRSPNENLNAPGMHFQPLAFEESCITPNPYMAPDAQPNRFYAYGVIARLALLAAAREMAEGTYPSSTREIG